MQIFLSSLYGGRLFSTEIEAINVWAEKRITTERQISTTFLEISEIQEKNLWIPKNQQLFLSILLFMERQHCHMSSDEYYMHSGHHYIYYSYLYERSINEYIDIFSLYTESINKYIACLLWYTQCIFHYIACFCRYVQCTFYYVLSKLRYMWFIFLSFGIKFTTVDCLWTLTQHWPPAAMLWAVQKVWWPNFFMMYPQYIAEMLVFKLLRFLWSRHFRTKWSPSFKKLGFQRFPSDLQMRKSTHTLFWRCQTAVWYVWV